MNKNLSKNFEAKTKRFLQRVTDLDWRSVIYLVVHQEKMSKSRVKSLLLKYCYLLTMTYLFPNMVFVPTSELDIIHHAFTADTYLYQTAMQQLEHQLYHYPYAGFSDGDDRQTYLENYHQTQVLFKELFGFDMASEEEEDHRPGGCYLMRNYHHFDHPKLTVDLTPDIDWA